MLTEDEKRLVKASWRLVAPLGETVPDLFYRLLFELKPEYRSLFSEDMAPQKKKLLGMLAFIVKAIDWGIDQWQEEVPEDNDLFIVVLAMGRRHGKLYRIPDASYAVVGEALLWTLDMGLGEAFTPETKAAWTRVYTMVASIMLMGSRNAIDAA